MEYYIDMSTPHHTEEGTMTQGQIAWAARHDWFRGVTRGGAVVVDVTTYGPDGESHHATVEVASFSALRELVGY